MANSSPLQQHLFALRWDGSANFVGGCIGTLMSESVINISNTGSGITGTTLSSFSQYHVISCYVMLILTTLVLNTRPCKIQQVLTYQEHCGTSKMYVAAKVFDTCYSGEHYTINLEYEDGTDDDGDNVCDDDQIQIQSKTLLILVNCLQCNVTMFLHMI